MADVERWITIHPKGNKEIEGQPIPVKEGQSNKQATESFLAKKKNKAIKPEEKAKENFVKTMNTPVDNVVDVQAQYDIIENRYIRQMLESAGVKPYKVKKLPSVLSEKQIIDRVGNLDTHKGSCSSFAFAYIGNKAGFDVLDYRGGESLAVFADRLTLREIANLKGVTSFSTEEYDDYNAALKLTNKIQEGKEYYFAISGHAAIVRKKNNKLEYLELQDRKNENGFKRLNWDSLKKRFKIKKSRQLGYTKLKTMSFLIECESLGKNKDFQTMLAYINNKRGN